MRVSLFHLGGKTYVTTNKRGTLMRIIHLLKDESGATAIEYGLLAALIAVAAIVAMSAVGTQLSSTFSSVSSTLGTAR